MKTEAGATEQRDVVFRCPLCGSLSDDTEDWAVKLAEEVDCYKAMKDGVAIRIADIERDRDRLRAIITRLPRKDDIELSLRANNMGGLDFREDYCQCDASVGQSPCPYCAIDSVLRRALRAVEAGGSEP